MYPAVSKVRTEWRPVHVRLEELTAQVQDNFPGVGLIKPFLQRCKHATEIEIRCRRLRDDMLRASMLSFVPGGVIGVTSGIGDAMIVLVGGTMHGQRRRSICLHSVSDPDLPTLFAVREHQRHAAKGSSPLRTGVRVTRCPARYRESSGRRTASRDALGHRPGRGGVAYQPNQRVPSDVDIQNPEGTLVGATGAGKSTVCKLIPVLYDPQQGTIGIGDHDVCRLKLDLLRSHIAILLQDVFLVHGTVRQKLLFGRPDATHNKSRLRLAQQLPKNSIELYPRGMKP